MKIRTIGLIIMLSVMVLAGCSKDDTVAAAPSLTTNQNETGQAWGGEPFQSAYLDTSYDGALPVTMQLSLGTLQLEETDNAVIPAQAKKLLPFWQGLQSGSIQNTAERNAVLKGIEGAMTEAQMHEIAAMQLTFEDMNAWAQANGVELPQTRFDQGGQGQGPFANMSEEERTKLRAELQNMTPEERQARLRELGIEFPQSNGPDGQSGPGGGGDQRRGSPGGGRFNVLTEPVIKLLTARSSE